MQDKQVYDWTVGQDPAFVTVPKRTKHPTPNKVICRQMAARALTYPWFMFNMAEDDARAAARKRRNQRKALRRRK